MAITEFATGDAQTVNYWSKRLYRQMLGSTLYFKKFLGTRDDSIIYQAKDLEKSAGDTVKYDLLIEMSGPGVTGDNLLVDNEEELTYYQDSIKIDQLRHAHKFGRMSQQRTVHDLRKDGMWALSRWWGVKLETMMFRYLCGDTTISHAQAGTAPDTGHYIVSGDVTHTGVIATDEGNIGSNDQFKLEDIDYAKEKAQNATIPVRPVNIDGDEYYVVVLHPYSVTDMKLNLGGGTTAKWMDIQQYANVRGLKNPIFSGALGVYNGCILFESKYIHSPVANVRRNLLLGAQSGIFGIGNAYDKTDMMKYGKDSHVSWVEEERDYKNRKGIAAGCIFGIKKATFNSADHGTMVISSYAAAH